MSSSNLHRISRADGMVMNAYKNLNNAGYMLNYNRNEIRDGENEMQNRSIVLERRTDRELKHKGKLQETKKGGVIRICSTNVHGSRGNNDLRAKRAVTLRVTSASQA